MVPPVRPLDANFGQPQILNQAKCLKIIPGQQAHTICPNGSPNGRSMDAQWASSRRLLLLLLLPPLRPPKRPNSDPARLVSFPFVLLLLEICKFSSQISKSQCQILSPFYANTQIPEHKLCSCLPTLLGQEANLGPERADQNARTRTRPIAHPMDLGWLQSRLMVL